MRRIEGEWAKGWWLVTKEPLLSHRDEGEKIDAGSGRQSANPMRLCGEACPCVCSPRL